MMLVTNYGLSSNKNITLYDNGFFFCSFSNSIYYIYCNDLLFDSSKTYKEIEYMYADFKLIKQNIQNIKNVDYSFIG